MVSAPAFCTAGGGVGVLGGCATRVQEQSLVTAREVCVPAVGNVCRDV